MTGGLDCCFHKTLFYPSKSFSGLVLRMPVMRDPTVDLYFLLIHLDKSHSRTLTWCLLSPSYCCCCHSTAWTCWDLRRSYTQTQTRWASLQTPTRLLRLSNCLQSSAQSPSLSAGFDCGPMTPSFCLAYNLTDS